MMKKRIFILVLAAVLAHAGGAAEESMDKMWGESTGKAGIEKTDRVALFRDGNYGMFIHWGLYSHLGGQWKDRTFYGIGEWIKKQMNIPDEAYMALAKDFNPTELDAREIVRVAKAAGMKWIIITAKHHDGFAMFKSAHPFNIVDATPFGRDPMTELSAACREAGLGFALVEELKELQPDALLCSRIGYGMGDYASRGDMDVPLRSEKGLWETCDTTNDSWSYAWYDNNWKDTGEILHRLAGVQERR